MNCCLRSPDDALTEDLQEQIKKLKEENTKLKASTPLPDWRNNIDIFVEQWFEENKDDVDIGVVDFKLFKIDLLPDKVEKYIYKKVLKILYSFITTLLAPHPKSFKEN
ncbi:MAG: hypothetical protein CML47_01910 [Rhodobacteraceae bacterium]|jgi:hypothetical protein|nr:MAG: hypothetical protein CML47_01910 [Paracoccaceae bacterium]|tara:strand:+ start:3655 stop:3978 length:324 start_codon:yes stop_codon:yes gene_type:complete